MGTTGILLVLLIAPISSPPSDESLKTESARFGDMAAYWIAGRAVLEHENPFNPLTVESIENREHLHQAFVIWNPPWILPFVAALGLLPFSLAAIAWCIANIAMAIVSGLALSEKTGLSLFATVIATVTFVPVLFCVGMSQWSILVLASVIGYDSLRQRHAPFLAGILLALAAMKPHLVALVWLVPLFSGTKRERLLTVAGIASMLTLLLAITYLWDAHLIPDYLEGLRHPASNAPTNYWAATPAVWMKMTLERWTGSPLPGLQFIPLAIAALGTALWLINRRPREANTIPVLLLLSALFLPYGWHYDQVLLLPAYLLLWSEVASSSCRYRSMRLAIVLILLNGGMGAMAFLGVDESLYFVWPPTLVLVCLLENVLRQPIRPKLALAI